MKRVASLYLPHWSIDRLRRIERRTAPPAEADGRAAYDALGAVAAAERATHCSVPKEGGWRPGARWARTERAQVEAAIEALPAHRRPPQRELGRVSQAADNPFRRPAEERVAPPAALSAQARPPLTRELSRRTEAAEPLFRPGTRGWDGREVQTAINALPAHQRPSFQELSRRSEVVDNPFAPSLHPGSSGEVGHHAAPPALRAPTDDAVAGLVPTHGKDRAEAAGDRAALRSTSRQGPGDGTVANTFRPMPSDEVGRFAAQPSLQFPGEHAPAKAGRGAALRVERGRDRYRNEAPHGSLSIKRAAAMPPVHGPGEDVVVRRARKLADRERANKAPRRSARDGHGGEAGYIAPPSLAQLAAMPAVQFPGEGPHPDNHGKSEPTAPTYGQGRFFQTGRTLGSVVARVCRDEEVAATLAFSAPDEPPLVLTHKVGARVEIAAVNPAARALGLAPGTALTLARAQVPDLEVRATDPQGDAAELRALAELLARRWAPIVAISDTDGLLIDLTGVAHLHGGEARFARRLLRLLARHGIGGRIAIADSAGAAWALARYGRAVVEIVAPGAQVAAVAPLPIAALRLEPPALDLLARLGVDSVAQLIEMPRAPLVRRFGAAIVTRLDQATGRAPEPLDPVIPPTRIEVEQRFAEPLLTAEPIAHWLSALMTRLVGDLARNGQGARTVELVAARIDNRPQRLRLGFARPTRDAAHMLRLALRRIEEIDPGCGIEALVLIVDRADPLGAEALAASLAGAAAPDLAPLIDALVNRIGAGRLWRVQPVESDVPERALTLIAPLDPPAGRDVALKADDVRRLDARAPDHPWHPRWPRPALLLRRPEPVEHVIAELPDQPPRRFTWRGTSHRVVCADGPERIAGEWWRRSAERLAVRDYYRVEDEAGERFWLYRRGDGLRSETGDLAWFLHGR